jgi:hypothetical protein
MPPPVLTAAGTFSLYGLSAPGAPSYNPTWYAATAVYFDPGGLFGGSDENLGTSPLSPLATWQEVVRRYGSDCPQFNYGQSCSYFQMSGQPLSQDEVFFTPKLSGGGQALLIVYLVSAGADFVAGALGGGYGYAGAVPSAGGTMMTMATVPSYVTAKTLLENVTRGSYAVVDSVAGGTAKLAQPHTKSSLTQTALTVGPTADNDWAPGDVIRAWTCQNCNLGRWAPQGGDEVNFQACWGGVYFARIPDTNGAQLSTFSAIGDCNTTVFSCCVVDCALQGATREGRNNVHALSFQNCFVAGTISLYGANIFFFGGVSNQGLEDNGNACAVLNNAALHGASTFAGVRTSLSSGVFSDGTLDIYSPSVYATSFVWGSYALAVFPGAAYINSTGSTFALKAALTSGAITWSGTLATGTSYAAGVWTDGVNLTPANLDAHGGLQNPPTGARICNLT